MREEEEEEEEEEGKQTGSGCETPLARLTKRRARQLPSAPASCLARRESPSEI